MDKLDEYLRRAISRPYGPGLIEAASVLGLRYDEPKISRPYGPGLIEADDRFVDRVAAQRDFPALWAGPH